MRDIGGTPSRRTRGFLVARGHGHFGRTSVRGLEAPIFLLFYIVPGPLARHYLPLPPRDLIHFIVIQNEFWKLISNPSIRANPHEDNTYISLRVVSTKGFDGACHPAVIISFLRSCVALHANPLRYLAHLRICTGVQSIVAGL